MSITPPKDATPIWHGLLRMMLRFAIIIGLVVLVKYGLDGLSDKMALLESDAAAGAMTGLIVTVLIGYALLIATPFVPGVEIGIAILMIQGADAAPVVYLATVSGMALAFVSGQYLSLDWLSRTCADLYMFRLCTILHRIKSTSRSDRLASLNDRMPRWLAPVLVGYRYVTLGLLINLPGNIALGGGGGIMIGAGLSRLFQTGYVVLTIALATLPVPLAVWLLGTDILH